MNKRNLFISGATGFIGKHLVTNLVLGGRYNIRTVTRDLSKAGDIDPAVEKIQGDLTDEETVYKALQGIDAVIHLAGLVSDPNASQENFINANVRGTEILLEACKKSGIKKFIHCSSSSVYGSKSNGSPRSELTEPNPDSTYGITKYKAEKVLLDGFDPGKVSLAIIRPTGVYGPGDMKGLKFFQDIKRDKVRFYLNDNQVVHPTHVMDVVNAISLILERDELRHEIFNIGGERSLRLVELVSLTARLMNRSVIQISVPKSMLPVMAFILIGLYKMAGKECPVRDKLVSNVIDHSNDISKAKKGIGFKPVPFEQGMEETYKYYLENNCL